MLTPTLFIALGIMAAAIAFPQPRRVLVPGLVLVAGVVAMLGVHSLPVGPATEAWAGGERLNVFAVMRQASGRSASSDFESARLIGALGQWTLDLRQATIPPGEQAVVDVFTAMGTVTILLPDGWDVDASALRVIGVVDDARGLAHGDSERYPEAAASASRLVLRGVVMLGKVEIRS